MPLAGDGPRGLRLWRPGLARGGVPRVSAVVPPIDGKENLRFSFVCERHSALPGQSAAVLRHQRQSAGPLLGQLVVEAHKTVIADERPASADRDELSAEDSPLWAALGE